MMAFRIVLAAMIAVSFAEPIDYNRMKRKIEQACGGVPSDVLFILDSSSSIWGPDFDKQKAFVSNMVDLFDVRQEMTRIGVMTFSDTFHPTFDLNQYNSEAKVKQAISYITQDLGGTNTADAIKYAAKVMLSPRNGGRPGVVKQVAIVLTDGESRDPPETAKQAAHAHAQDIFVFAIGIGDGVNKAELESIASKPSADYVFEVEGYDALDKIKKLLAYKTCEVKTTPAPTTTTTEPPQQAEPPGADVIFGLSDSTSAGETNKVIAFMIKLIKVFNIGTANGAIKVSVVPKECTSMKGVRLTDYEDKATALKLFQSQRIRSSDTGTIIRYINNAGFRGARVGARKVAVVFIDGPSANKARTLAEAQRAREEDNIEIFVIAVGKKVDMDEVNAVASPGGGYVYSASNYYDLGGIHSRLLDRINNMAQQPEEPLR